jgi:hypothetical protein
MTKTAKRSRKAPKLFDDRRTTRPPLLKMTDDYNKICAPAIVPNALESHKLAKFLISATIGSDRPPTFIWDAS